MGPTSLSTIIHVLHFVKLTSATSNFSFTVDTKQRNLEWNIKYLIFYIEKLILGWFDFRNLVSILFEKKLSGARFFTLIKKVMGAKKIILCTIWTYLFCFDPELPCWVGASIATFYIFEPICSVLIQNCPVEWEQVKWHFIYLNLFVLFWSGIAL